MGDIGRARVAAVKSFLSEKMCMGPIEVESAGVVEACWFSNDCLCARFRSIVGAKSLNPFK